MSAKKAARALEDYSRALRGQPSVAQERAAILVGCLASLTRLVLLGIVIYVAIRLAR